jgi:hypothetical protein
LKKEEITPAMQRGRAWERQVFGNDIHRHEWPEVFGWQTAIHQVVCLQASIPWRPREPKTKISNEIFECVQSYLPERLASKLEFYCAIGTSLDIKWGVDGFFMIDNFIVTIDLTTTHKQSYEADVLIIRSNVSNSIWRPCREIAEKLKKGLL